VSSGFICCHLRKPPVPCTEGLTGLSLPDGTIRHTFDPPSDAEH
jgi:hypothetical protein